MLGTRIFLLLATLALLAPGLASAKPTPPEQLAKQTVQKVLADMEGRRDELRNNPRELHHLINKDLVPLVDLPYMSQLVLGRYWRQASKNQRKRFEKAFKNMLIDTYGSALLGLNDNIKIDYKPVRAPKGANNVVFKAVIHSSGGKDIPVSLHLHLVDGDWKAYDGSVGNLSFVTNYRGQFRSYIQRKGLEKTIEKMEQKYNP
jgi:phospholipid transport system substrate-binding protein